MIRQCRALTTGKTFLEPLTSTRWQWQIGINHLMLYQLGIVSHQENSDRQNNEISSKSLWFNSTALVPYPEPYPNTVSITQTPAAGTGQNLPHRIRGCLSTSGLGVLSDSHVPVFKHSSNTKASLNSWCVKPSRSFIHIFGTKAGTQWVLFFIWMTTERHL